uniref:Uncharacterized protein n=1 Tax=Rhizophora mucronata TaxID=61149 RepID=A0A2P2IR65_RHIMU
MTGGGSYSMWWKVGVGGSLALSGVGSMNGGTLIDRPRAMSDHELMKCMAEAPSAKV